MSPCAGGCVWARCWSCWAFVPSTRHGRQVRGPCPVHGSQSPRSRSFAAHLERHCWHCFRCGAHGNALDLWAAVTKRPLYEAALDLCRRLHLDIPWLPARPRPAQPAVYVRKLRTVPSSCQAELRHARDERHRGSCESPQLLGL